MDHYLDIKVLPDPEFLENTLMNALFAKLHRALVDVGKHEIGVSFPDAGKTLGTCLRLHGSAAALARLMEQNWLKGLRDYTDASAMRPIPSKVQYRIVKRVQVNSSVERLRRRSVSKGWLTEAEAAERIPASKAQRSSLPYLQLKSHSTGQAFRLFIEQGPVQQVASDGSFSDYGLSTQASVPYF